MNFSFSNTTSYRDYPRAFILAIVVHVILLSMIMLSINWTTPIQAGLPNVADTQPINAVAINSKVVDLEVKRLQRADLQKKQAEKIHQQQLQQAALAAKQARQREQQKLAQIQEEQQEFLEKQQAEQKAWQAKIAAIKQQQQQEKQRLAQLQKQKADELKAEKAQAAAKAAKAKTTPAPKPATATAAKTKTTKANKNPKKKDAINQTDLQKQLNDQLHSEEAQMAAARNKEQQNIISHYMALIKNTVESNWNRPDTASPDLKCQLLLQLIPGGTVGSVSIYQSSGDPAFDQSAINAVYKSQPLPVPNDPDLFDKYFRRFIITA